VRDEEKKKRRKREKRKKDETSSRKRHPRLAFHGGKIEDFKGTKKGQSSPIKEKEEEKKRGKRTVNKTLLQSSSS